jgi:hypothetical protein
MSIRGMNWKEREMHYLGVVLTRSLESIADQDTAENIARHEWLVSLMETTARNSADTAANISQIRRNLWRPGIPF